MKDLRNNYSNDINLFFFFAEMQKGMLLILALCTNVKRSNSIFYFQFFFLAESDYYYMRGFKVLMKKIPPHFSQTIYARAWVSGSKFRGHLNLFGDSRERRGRRK